MASRSDDEILAFANVPWSTFELPWDWRMTLGLSITLSPRLQAALARIRNWWPGEYIGVHWRRDRDWLEQPGRWAPTLDRNVTEVVAKIRRVQETTGLLHIFLATDAPSADLLLLESRLSGIFTMASLPGSLAPQVTTVELGLLEQELLAYRFSYLISEADVLRQGHYGIH